MTYLKNRWSEKVSCLSWALLRESVIQANGRLPFEDGSRSGGLLHCVSHCISFRTKLADIMDTLGK